MAKEYVDKKSGERKMSYTPYDKRKYYGEQLASGKDKEGKELTKRQKAYRAGYVKSWKDGRNLYRYKKRNAVI